MTAVLPVGPDTRGPELRSAALGAARPLPERIAAARPRSHGPRWGLLTGDLAAGVVTSVVVHPLGTGGSAAAELAVAVLWVCLLAGSRSYEWRSAAFAPVDLRRTARAAAGLALALLLIGSLAGEIDPARVVALTSGCAVAAIALRGATLLALGRGRGAARVVVAGHRHGVDRVRAELAEATSRFSVVAACLTGSPGENDLDVPVHSGLRELQACVREHAADAVVVVPCRHLDPARLRRLCWELETDGTQFFVVTGLRELGRTRASLDHAGSLSLIHVRHAELRGARRLAKEVWERLAAAAALVVLAPALLVLAALVRADSAGPALFRQTRIGRDGTPFTMLKLRTMTTDAELRRADLTAETPHDGVLFKLRADPRITRIGGVLRKYSLDELPQLINVVRGEMALVGPRPPLPDEVARYDPDTHRRLAVTPGLTGLWQVSGRSDLSWEESVRLDLRYVENWSIGLDLQILLRTVSAVVGHRGAY